MRIVSLVPSHTEILFALGLGEQVVGVTVHCDYPQQAIQKSKIGSFAYPEVDRIISLRPNLVLAGGKIHTSYVNELRKAGITVFDFEPSTVAYLFDAMENISQFTKTGREVVSTLKNKISLIKEKSKTQAKPKVVFIMGEHIMMTPGPTSCQYDALSISGADLISFTNDDSYVPIVWEDIVNYDPEIILACGSSQNEPMRKRCPGCKLIKRPCVRNKDSILNNPFLSRVIAIRTRRVHTIPCHFLCRTGPRLIEGMEKLNQLFEI